MDTEYYSKNQLDDGILLAKKDYCSCTVIINQKYLNYQKELDKQEENKNQFQDNVLGDRRIHIDIIFDKYEEISEKIIEVLAEIEGSERLYKSIDESLDNISLKENILKSNQAKKSYLDSLKQQSLRLKTEIERFNSTITRNSV